MLTCPSLTNLRLNGTSPPGGESCPRHPTPSAGRPPRGTRRRRRGKITNPNRADWRRVNRARENDRAVVLSRDTIFVTTVLSVPVVLALTALLA